MPFLLLKQIPRNECLLEAARLFPDLDPSACEVFLHLMQTGDEAFRVTDANLSKHAISQGRFMVLMLLLDKQANCPRARTPAELADLAHVTRATMTGLIDTLERDGLVKREPDLTDRRMMSVHLTEKGHDLLGAILPEHFRLMSALVQALDESERRILVQLLGKIRAQAASMAAPAAAPASGASA